jgi:hypothetical protein
MCGERDERKLEGYYGLIMRSSWTPTPAFFCANFPHIVRVGEYYETIGIVLIVHVVSHSYFSKFHMYILVIFVGDCGLIDRAEIQARGPPSGHES